MPVAWNSEPLITGLTLAGPEDKCYNPAFAREWPGTAEYETEVEDRTRLLTDQDEEFDLPRKLQQTTATSDEKVAELLVEYDTDGDGKLSKEEVTVMMIKESQLSFETETDDNGNE